jgi:hypothetical protein
MTSRLAGDPIARVVDYLFERMQVDDDWAVRGEDGFAWWGHRQAQRIYAGPVRDVGGMVTRALHIESDLLRNVPAGPDTLARLAGINRLATLSAYVADAEGTRVRLHASVSVTADNLPMARGLALHAMALQAADAAAEAEPLAEIFGGDVDESGHPEAGLREEPDEMLGVAALYEDRGSGPSPFATDELSELVHLDPRPWLLASSSATGLDAEFAFGPHERSRLDMDAEARHPALGAGLQVRLVLPVVPDIALVQRLNASEILEPDAHQLGGWCLDEDLGVMFATFLPAAAHTPKLTTSLAWHMAARNDWARALLHPVG